MFRGSLVSYGVFAVMAIKTNPGNAGVNALDGFLRLY